LGDWEIGRLGDWEIGRLGDWGIGGLGDWGIGGLEVAGGEKYKLLNSKLNSKLKTQTSKLKKGSLLPGSPFFF
jgi:hypothetical protein